MMVKLSMPTSNARAGFSIIELMVALVIIVMMMSFIAPRLFTKSAAKERQEFFARIEMLVYSGLVQAMRSGQAVQLYVDVDHKALYLKGYDVTSQAEDFHERFKKIKTDYFTHDVEIPDQVVIKNFFIGENPDEVKSGVDLHEVWFYALPDGTVQPVTMNMEFVYQNPQDDRQIGIKIHPFLGRVEVYDAFCTPA